MKRREFLAGGITLGTGLARGATAAASLDSNELSPSEFVVPGSRAFGRVLLLVPKVLPREPELLVLLHGLGETHDQRLGVRAFAERYGLMAAVSRLTRPPLQPTLTVDYFGDGRLAEINGRLARRPFRCPVLACPFTPNPYKSRGDAVTESFARFVGGALKSEVEKRVGVTFAPTRSMITGVSLGGYLAIEVFLRRPELFCAFGSAQGAFGQNQSARYAAGIASISQRLGHRRAELLTSSLDPYRRSNQLLHQELQRRGQVSRLRVSPGPHDQRWLRESGVIEMLLSADDVFADLSQRSMR